MNQALRRSAAHVFVESLAAPVLDADDRHHLARVLRLRAGQVVSVGDGAGAWRLCRFSGGGELQVDGEIIAERAPAPALTVAFAIPKGDRPEWIVQKLTEIGIDRIVVLHTARSVVHWEPDRAERQLERLRKVAREAAMQSRRVRRAEVVGPVSPLELAGASTDAKGIALAEPGGGALSNPTSTVLVGPEGGWTDSELTMFPTTVTLGHTILRVETAAIVAAVLLAALRDRS